MTLDRRCHHGSPTRAGGREPQRWQGVRAARLRVEQVCEQRQVDLAAVPGLIGELHDERWLLAGTGDGEGCQGRRRQCKRFKGMRGGEARDWSSGIGHEQKAFGRWSAIGGENATG